MEPYDFVHNIKAKKANAHARYRLFTNITKAVQFIEAFVAVALISWSSTHLSLFYKFSGKYLLAFTSYLMNQHVVFLVGNVIVFLCYLISRYTDSGYESGGSRIHYDKVGDETALEPANLKLVPLQVAEPPTESGHLIIPNEKVITETVTAVTEPELPAVTAIKQAAKQIERFQRTQSELKSKISVKQHPELRRSVTERRRSMVDELSNEEFRIAVEAFILKQQRFLKQQSVMVKDGS